MQTVRAKRLGFLGAVLGALVGAYMLVGASHKAEACSHCAYIDGWSDCDYSYPFLYQCTMRTGKCKAGPSCTQGF